MTRVRGSGPPETISPEAAIALSSRLEEGTIIDEVCIGISGI
jgi:hypothetical protein